LPLFSCLSFPSLGGPARRRTHHDVLVTHKGAISSFSPFFLFPPLSPPPPPPGTLLGISRRLLFLFFFRFPSVDQGPRVGVFPPCSFLPFFLPRERPKLRRLARTPVFFFLSFFLPQGERRSSKGQWIGELLFSFPSPGPEPDLFFRGPRPSFGSPFSVSHFFFFVL